VTIRDIQAAAAVAPGGIAPRPFAQIGDARLDALDFVLTDIDDTLTTDGRLPAIAYAALETLQRAGLKVVPITGRPAGWCDLIARIWPVDAVVGENGAFYFACEPGGGMTRVFHKTDAERRADRARLDALAGTILASVPRARISADQPFREADLAIDFAEDGDRLTETEIDAIVACFEAAGAVAKVSSIHVNGWYGQYDKLVMTRRLLADHYGVDMDTAGDRIAFVGDSPNDAPMFAFFDTSIAVANFADFAHRSPDQPKWMTGQSGGQGFAAVAAAILRAKGA
jgi:HAD superfamily hydrolase (TIGR01484 family)